MVDSLQEEFHRFDGSTAIRAAGTPPYNRYARAADAEGKIKGDGTGVPILLGLHDGYRGTCELRRGAADFTRR
jgi:hypothetical protein